MLPPIRRRAIQWPARSSRRCASSPGADAIEDVEAKARELLAQAQASRGSGGDLAYDDTKA